VSPTRLAGTTPRVIRTFKRRKITGPAPALGDEHETLASAFHRLLPRAVRRGDTVADLGTGRGRAALAAASLARRVVGIDRDSAALEAARACAAERGLKHVQYARVDLEQRGLLSRNLRHQLDCPAGFDSVVAHLCVSDRILKRAAALVKPGGRVLATALHADHWYETGRASRFSYDERTLLRALEAAWLVPLEVEIETSEMTFASLEAVKNLCLGGSKGERYHAWRGDGRWRRLQERFHRGRRTLTTSRITALCERSRQAAGTQPSR
jgi:SAM-dependent methyltransferase